MVKKKKKRQIFTRRVHGREITTKGRWRQVLQERI